MRVRGRRVVALVLFTAALACSTQPTINGDALAPPPDAPATPPDTAVREAAPRSPDGPPAARLMLSVTEVDFGTVNIGAQATSAVVVTNTGDLPSSPLAASVTMTADFKATDNCAGRRLGIGETCVVTLQFTPTSVGARTTTGQVSQTAGDRTPLPFSARGTGRMAPDAAPQDARDAGARPDVPAEARPPDTARPPDAALDSRSQ